MANNGTTCHRYSVLLSWKKFQLKRISVKKKLYSIIILILLQASCSLFKYKIGIYIVLHSSGNDAMHL